MSFLQYHILPTSNVSMLTACIAQDKKNLSFYACLQTYAIWGMKMVTVLVQELKCIETKNKVHLKSKGFRVVITWQKQVFSRESSLSQIHLYIL